MAWPAGCASPASGARARPRARMTASPIRRMGTFYEALCWQVPFSGDTPRTAAESHGPGSLPRHSSWPKGLGRPSIRADHVGRSPHPVFALRRISANSWGSAPRLSGGLGVRPGAIIERLPPGCAVTPSFLRVRPGISLRRLQACALRHHAALEEAPQRDQQLPGEGHDPHLAGSGPAAAEPRLIPLAQAAARLIPQPAPGRLDGDRPDVPTPRLADPLFPALGATLVRRWRESGRRPDLLAVLEPSPPEELVHIDPRAGGPDRAQAEQLPDFVEGLAAPVGNRALAFALQLENPHA